MSRQCPYTCKHRSGSCGFDTKSQQINKEGFCWVRNLSLVTAKNSSFRSSPFPIGFLNVMRVANCGRLIPQILIHAISYYGILERESVPREVRKCSSAQGPHSELVPRAFWRLVSKSCDECKSSFARGCEAKQWSHWICSSLGTIFQPMRINSVPDVKCFCNNNNVLYVQSMVWHFVWHPVSDTEVCLCLYTCFLWPWLSQKMAYLNWNM